MTILIEQIDELRKRTNCSYEEAKTLLEKHNGNVVEAIVELEKMHRVNESHENTSTFWVRLKSLFIKGFKTRFIVLRRDDVIINLSINFMILTVLFALHLVIIGLVVSLILGYKFKIKKDEDGMVDIDRIIVDVKDKVKSATSSMVDDNPKAEKKSDSNYNEITIE